MLKENYHFWHIIGLQHKSIVCFLKVSSDNSDQEELIPISKAIYEIEIILIYIVLQCIISN